MKYPNSHIINYMCKIRSLFMYLKIYSFFIITLFVTTNLFANNLTLQNFNKLKIDLINNEITINQFNEKINDFNINSDLFQISKDLFLDDALSLEDYLEVIENVLISETSLIQKNKSNNTQENIISGINGEYIFQTEIIKLSQYIVGDLNYGELFDNKFIFENNYLKEINLTQNSEDLLKFSKVKLVINENNFIIKSNVIDPSDPSAPLKYIFEGNIDNGKINGRMTVSYYGNELPQGTILVVADTINKIENNLESNINDNNKEINLKLKIVRVNTNVPTELVAKINNIEKLTFLMDADKVKEIKFKEKSNNFFTSKNIRSFKDIKIKLTNQSILKGKSRLVVKQFRSENISIYWNIDLSSGDPQGNVVIELAGRGPQIEFIPIK